MRSIAKPLAVVTVMTLALAGCGAGDDDAGAATADAGSGSGAITFSSHIAGMDKVVAAFNAEQSDIKVTFEQTPAPAKGGNAKLTNSLKAGNAPDLATVEYQDLPSFVSLGGLRPVGDLAKDTLNGMPKGIVSSVTFADQTWAVPYDAAPMVLFYRADVYKALGINPPATWQDFEKAAQTIASKKPGTSIASFWPNESKLFAGLAWQNKAHWFQADGDAWKVSMDDPQTTQVADYWQGLIDKKLVKVEQGFSDEWANSLASGKVVGYIGAAWGAAGLVTRTPDTAGKWRVAQLPSWGTPASGMYGGSTFVITKNSKNAKAAATFASWLATSGEGFKARGDAGVTYPASTGLVATAKAAVPTTHFGGQDIYAEFDKSAASIVEGWTWGPTLSTLTALNDGFGKVGSGGSVEEALQAAQASTITEMKTAGLKVDGS
jgi:multiple sugar transport system substrate-binding protein